MSRHHDAGDGISIKALFILVTPRGGSEAAAQFLSLNIQRFGCVIQTEMHPLSVGSKTL